jgi:predicted nucleotidyltransferase
MGYRLAPKERRKKRLTAELERLVHVLKTQDVEQVILFGSLMSGNVNSASDIDLLVVKQTDKRFLDRLDEMYSLLQPTVALDLLVYTPEEAEVLTYTNRFIGNIFEHGRVLYEKESALSMSEQVMEFVGRWLA